MDADTLASARAAIERDRAAGIEDGHSPVDAGEHDAAAGLLQGRCRICGEPWPCPTSRLPLYLALAEVVAGWIGRPASETINGMPFEWPADRDGWCIGCGESQLARGGPFHADDCPALAVGAALAATSPPERRVLPSRDSLLQFPEHASGRLDRTTLQTKRGV